ncbi:MAG: DUF2520 domain-containing protein [Bdellovibrio sp.]
MRKIKKVLPKRTANSNPKTPAAPKNSWLIIGSGRLATHLKFFLPQLVGKKHSLKPTFSVRIHQWTRSESLEKLDTTLKQVDRILLAIPDSAIQKFLSTIYDRNPEIFNAKTWVHFSGCLSLTGVRSAHPLMSFGPRLYKVENYKKIHWTCEKPWSLEDCLPGVQASWSSISSEEKSLYHSACVMMGNLPLYWWTEAEKIFSEMKIPQQGWELYLNQVFENWHQMGARAFTGPLARGDHQTLISHLLSLQGRPVQKALAGVYESFIGKEK